jgi:hypothetical protein
MTRVKPMFTYDASSTTHTETIMENGFVEMVNVVMPNFTNAITSTVTVADTDGYTVWSKASNANNHTTLYGNGPDAVDMGVFPIDYGYTVTVLLSGAAGGSGGTVSVVFYCKSMGMGE